jgi:hypothetical protein
VLGILSKCESLRDLERFARRHHAVLTEALGLELKRPPLRFSLPLTWTPKTEPVLMRASLPARLGQEKPHETQASQP